ncbi:MAG: hypothetical protein U0X20_24375 [Caldilineaceae bacterium]
MPTTLRPPCIIAPHFLLVGLLACLLLSTACTSTTPLAANDDTAGLAAAEEFIGSKLPDGAADVHIAEQTGIDHLVQIRLMAKPSAVSSFLEQLGIATLLEPGYSPFPSSAGSGLPWWTPETGANARGAEAILDGKAFEVQVEESSPDAWLLYLRVYEAS